MIFCMVTKDHERDFLNMTIYVQVARACPDLPDLARFGPKIMTNHEKSQKITENRKRSIKYETCQKSQNFGKNRKILAKMAKNG